MSKLRHISVAVALTALYATTAMAVTVTVVNLSPSGQGFNDTTPTAPVGGNAGTTRGQQRLIALQYAADRWGEQLTSSVEIRVGAQFGPMTCSATSAQLGSAGANSLHANFAGAPHPNTWYPAALANRFAGFDLNPAADDIGATFSSSIGTTCSFPATWYYGLDGNPPGGALDFVTIALHELAHGLGFATYFDTNTGTRPGGFDDMFLTYIEDHSTGTWFASMSDAQRAAASLDSGNVHFTGSRVMIDSGSLTNGRHPSGHVQLYAPNPGEGSASLSHFDTALQPDDLMEPSYMMPTHNLILARAALHDIGWGTCGDGVVSGTEQCDDGNAVNGDCCSTTCRYEANGSACGSDGNACTNDVCNGSGACTHPNNTAPCNDGLFCNGPDQCNAGACTVHFGNPCTGGAQCNNVCNETADNCAVPVGTACADDGNTCTNDQCNGSGACVHPNNTAPCNDGLFCNGSDSCNGGSCSVHNGNPCSGGAACNNVCNEAADNCLAPAGALCADDGNVCTDDKCNGSGACQHPNNTAPCNDGTFCNGLDTCSAGTCSVHAGNPCSGGAECNNLCNEAGDTCAVPQGTACSADNNLCTDDVCNGNGACSHPNNTAPCDDGNSCTPIDACSGGVCIGQSTTCGDGTVQANCGEECDTGGIAPSGCDKSCRLDANGVRCKRAIGLQTRSLAVRDLAVMQRCLDHVASHRLGCVNQQCALNPTSSAPATIPGSSCLAASDCCPYFDNLSKDASSAAKLAMSADKAERSVRLACSLNSGTDAIKGSDDDIYVDPQTMGFATQCLDVQGACGSIEIDAARAAGPGNDLLDCVRCTGETVAGDLMLMHYPLAASESFGTACQRAIGVQARKLATAQLTLQQRCLDRVETRALGCSAGVCVVNPTSATPLPIAGSSCTVSADCCPDFDNLSELKRTRSKLDAAAIAASEALMRSCSTDRGADGVRGSSDDIYVSPNSLGYDIICPAVAGQCGSIDTNAMWNAGGANDLLECLTCTLDSASEMATHFAAP